MKIRAGAAGIHLFDRISGLNILLEEVAADERTWAVAPRQVSIALTNACDLHCPYCFAPKTHATLPFDRIISWLHELDDSGTIGVGFGGGEPTLYPKFADLCLYAAERTRLAVTLTTHGHHLDEALLARLQGRVHFVRVSMDGVGSTYERLRGRSFATLRMHLESIRKVAPFGINYVVNSDTMPEIASAATLGESVGASELLLLPERATMGHSGYTKEVSESLQSWVQGYTGNLRLAISESASEGFPVCDPLAAETGLQAYAHIDANGVLKRTSFENAGTPIGHEGVLAAINKMKQQLTSQS